MRFRKAAPDFGLFTAKSVPSWLVRMVERSRLFGLAGDLESLADFINAARMQPPAIFEGHESDFRTLARDVERTTSNDGGPFGRDRARAGLALLDVFPCYLDQLKAPAFAWLWQAIEELFSQRRYDVMPKRSRGRPQNAQLVAAAVDHLREGIQVREEVLECVIRSRAEAVESLAGGTRTDVDTIDRAVDRGQIRRFNPLIWTEGGEKRRPAKRRPTRRR